MRSVWQWISSDIKEDVVLDHTHHERISREYLPNVNILPHAAVCTQDQGSRESAEAHGRTV